MLYHAKSVGTAAELRLCHANMHGLNAQVRWRS